MLRIAALLCVLCGGPGSVWAETWLVAPLANQTGKTTLDWIGESVAESISDALRRQGVLVVDRDERKEGEIRLALRSNGILTKASQIKLAETLDANHLISGSFTVTEGGSAMGTLRLEVELVNVRDFQRGGRFVETGPLEDLAALQTRLAWQVLKQTLPQSAPGEEEFRRTNLNIRVDAVENYVRGLLAAGPEAREKFFQQALKLDARYSQASFQYGRLLLERGNLPSAALQLEKVQSWDPHYREASFLLGLARYRLKEFKGAVAAFERVSREVPLSEVWSNLGLAQWRQGMPEALESLRKALEGDPNDGVYHFNLGLVLLSRGAFAEAAEQFRATLEHTPGEQEATKLLGRCLRPQSGAPTREELAGTERLKVDFEEAAYWQLKALMKPAKK